MKALDGGGFLSKRSKGTDWQKVVAIAFILLVGIVAYIPLLLSIGCLTSGGTPAWKPFFYWNVYKGCDREKLID